MQKMGRIDFRTRGMKAGNSLLEQEGENVLSCREKKISSDSVLSAVLSILSGRIGVRNYDWRD